VVLSGSVHYEIDQYMLTWTNLIKSEEKFKTVTQREEVIFAYFLVKSAILLDANVKEEI